MKFQETKIKGVYVIKPESKVDDRGHFERIFCKKELTKIGIPFVIAQVNKSFTKYKGVIRGMHFQKEPMAEDKMIQCISGKIYDAIIDLRKGSRTYGQWMAVELSGQSGKMLFIPKGFAHGFQTLTDGCVVQYFMSGFYSKKHEDGIRWDDPIFNIKWPIKKPILSEKDKNWPHRS